MLIEPAPKRIHAARRLKMDRGLGLIVVDYIQMMTVPGKSSQTRKREIAEISRSLKALAKELSLPAVELDARKACCLNVTHRTIYRPQ